MIQRFAKLKFSVERLQSHLIFLKIWGGSEAAPQHFLSIYFITIYFLLNGIGLKWSRDGHVNCFSSGHYCDMVFHLLKMYITQYKYMNFVSVISYLRYPRVYYELTTDQLAFFSLVRFSCSFLLRARSFYPLFLSFGRPATQDRCIVVSLFDRFRRDQIRTESAEQQNVRTKRKKKTLLLNSQNIRTFNMLKPPNKVYIQTIWLSEYLISKLSSSSGREKLIFENKKLFWWFCETIWIL